MFLHILTSQFISCLHSELMDTFFIVIHKKPLIFLHWYHHISVLLFCWQSYVSHSPVGIIFCVMNYAVHSFMYFYYFLMAIHKKPKFINALYITLAQISQMVVGVVVTLISCYLIWFDKEVASLRGTDEECKLKPGNIVGALVMYGSYLFLFLQFFIRRYFNQGHRSSKHSKMSLADEFKGGPFKFKKVD
jgi:elongation of very long chain fatty acids protein 6